MNRLTVSALAGALLLVATSAHAQPPPVTPDDFVATASGSDQYEIMAAKVALTESRDATVRAFAVDMIRDHEAMTAALRQAAMRSGLKPPSDIVGGDQRQLLGALQGVRGPDFDRDYGRQQRLAHQQALTTMQGYARDGSDANLKAAAESALPMIERHLAAAQRLPQ